MAFNSFGTNTFGAAANKPAFGSFGTAGTTSPSTFGFGAQNKPTQNFGGNTAFGASTGAFGGAPTQTTFGASSGGAFGTTSPGGFGKPAFSAAASVPNNLGGLGGGGFGSTFGANAATSAFGRPAGTTSPSTAFGGGAFGGGGNTTGAFGTTPAFGTNTSTLGGGGGAFGGGGSTFGGAGFGAQPAAATSSPFGGGGAFGAGTTTGFGGAQQTQQQPSAFGGFGTTAPSFGTQATPAFGAPAGGGLSSAFGGGGFGQQQQQQGGTGNPRFSAATVADTTTKQGHSTTTNLSLQVITGMPQYANKSIEELRLEDYQRGNKGGAASGLGGFLGGSSTTGGLQSPFKPAGAFGSAPATTGAFGSSSFGAPAAASTGFGGNTFGATSSTPAFGAAPASSGFGSAGLTGGFGQQTSGFGASTGAFGQTGQTTGFGAGQTSTPFGQPSQTGFGQTAQPTGFGQPQTTAFGQTAPTGFGQQASTGFGQQASTGFGQQASTGFGQQANTGFGSTQPAFGAAPTTTGLGGTSAFGTPAFGQTQTQQTAPAFGAPAAGGAFGNGGFGGTATTPAFGQPQQQQTGGGFGGFGGFGATSTAAPATTTAFGSSTSGGFGSAAPATSFTLGGTSSAAPAFGGFGATSTTGGGGFGSLGGGGAAGGGGMFGGLGGTTQSQTGSTPSGFGTTGGGFGSVTTGGFGLPSSTATTSGFGQPQGAGGLKSSFSLPSATGTGGFGGFGGFGAQPQQQPAFGLGGTTGFGGTSTFGQVQSGQAQLGFSQNLPQQQLGGQQFQPTQSLDSRIDLLRRKKDELVLGTQSTLTGPNGEQLAPQQTEQQRPVPNLFAGFSGGESRSAYVRPSIAGGVKATTRVVPRGMGSSMSPATPAKTVTSAATPKLLLDTPAPLDFGSGASSRLTWSANGSEGLGTPAGRASSVTAELFAPRGRDAKKLLLSVTRLPDPTEDLPPPQHFQHSKDYNATAPTAITDTPKTVSGVSSPVKESYRDIASATPAKSIEGSAAPSNLASAQSSRYDPTPNRVGGRLGDATGLTPYGSTPLVGRRSTEGTPAAVNVIEDDAAESDSRVPRQIAFHHSSPVIAGRRGGPAAVVVEPSSNPPVLTKDDYFTSPDLSVLRRMTDSELSRVRDFAVFRPNVGRIEWEGETDVRGLDLDIVVRIDNKEVFVYEGVEDPPLGHGLNKPAVITLERVFPKSSASDEKKRGFVRKLEDFCVANDAEFLSYEPGSGQWVFAVKHFSRYGLDDDDDSEDENAPPPQEQQEAMETSPVRMHGTDFCGNVTPLAPSENIQRLRRILVKGANSQPTQLGSAVSGYCDSLLGQQDAASAGRQRQSTWMMTGPATVTAAATPAEQLERSLYREWNDKMTEGAAGLAEEALLLETGKRAFLPVEETFAVKSLREVKQRAAAARGLDPSAVDLSYTKTGLVAGQQGSAAMALRRGMTHHGLSMGRSFRVGWSADGRIVHPGKLLFVPNDEAYGRVHRVAVEAVDPTRWVSSRFGESSVTNVEPALSAILTSSHQQFGKGASMNPFSSSPDSAATSAVTSSRQLPQWKGPLADPGELHEYVSFLGMLKKAVAAFQGKTSTADADHPDWLACKALELVDAAYGQEKTSISANPEQRAWDLMPLFEDRPADGPPEMWERRRMALSRWLEATVAPQVNATDNADTGSCGQSPATYQRIFDLLSCRRLDDAVGVAENSGMFRLATLLSQVDGDASLPTLLRNQLEVWRYSDAEQSIPEDLLRIYRLVAATAFVESGSEDQPPLSMLRNLGWLRAIGALFWYCSQHDSLFVDGVGTLSAALDAYRIALADDLVDPPQCAHTADRDPLGACVDYPYAKHGLYHLLELLFPSASADLSATDMHGSDEEDLLVADTERKVVASLSPSGYTRDALDYRASYLVLVMLESAGIADPAAAYASIVRQHFISQLLSIGQWRWAVFVAMQIQDRAARHALARDIVLRFGGARHWEEEVYVPPVAATAALLAGGNMSSGVFLTRCLGVPEQWVHEATAYLCGCEFDYQCQVSYLNFAHQWHQAKQVLCVHIAPGAILASDMSARSLLHLLESIEQQEEQDRTNEQARGSHAKMLGEPYTDSWTDLADMFLAFLRLRDLVESLTDSDLLLLEGSRRRVEEEVLDRQLCEILVEAKRILARLSSFQKQQNLIAPHLQHAFHTQNPLSIEVMYDMCTYLYRLVSRLVELTPRAHQDPAERLALISDEFFRSREEDVFDEHKRKIVMVAPVREDALQATLNHFSSEYLEDAACRVMALCAQ